MLLLGPGPGLDQRTRQQGEKKKCAAPFDVDDQLMEVIHVKSDPHKSGSRIPEDAE